MEKNNKIDIIDAMREVLYSIDYYKDRVKENRNIAIKYSGLIQNMFADKIQAQERLVRILEIRFEKLKQQL